MAAIVSSWVSEALVMRIQAASEASITNVRTDFLMTISSVVYCIEAGAILE